MTGTELERILSHCEELHSDLKMILTVNARHTAASGIAGEYGEIMRQHNNAGLCFVAGNRAYLSEDEHDLDAALRIRQLVECGRNQLPDAPIFIGSEGQLGLAAELSSRYSVIPFMLLDGSLEENVATLRSANAGRKTAVYCPCHLGGDASNLVESFGFYALRRRRVRRNLRKQGFDVSKMKSELASGLAPSESAALDAAIRELVLCGSTGVWRGLRQLSLIGVDYAAFLIGEQNVRAMDDFSQVLEQFNKLNVSGEL